MAALADRLAKVEVETIHAPSSAELAPQIMQAIWPGDTVLVKARSAAGWPLSWKR